MAYLVESEEEVDEGQEPKGEKTNEDEAPPAFCHTLVEAPLPNSIRIWGTIGKKHILILVDTCSTHNFLKQGLVEKLRIEVKDHLAFNVTVEDSSKLQCTNKCEQVDVII